MFIMMEREIPNCGQVWSSPLWHPISNTGIALLFPTNLTYSAGLSKNKKKKRRGKGNRKTKKIKTGKGRREKGNREKGKKKGK